MTDREREARDVLGEALDESLDVEFIVRRNKAHDERQWEVVRSWGGEIISDDTQEVVARFRTGPEAEDHAWRLEQDARRDHIIARLAEAGYRIVKFVKLDPEPFNPPPDTGG